MKNLKKLSALVLALVMALSLCVNVVAKDGNEVYLSPATGTAYTTVTSASSVELNVYFSAMDASYNWYNTGFDNEADAKTASWIVTYEDDDLVNGNVAVSSGTVNGLVTSKGTVNLNSGKHGVAIIHVAYGSYTLDLTICVEAGSIQPTTTNITCGIKDVRLASEGQTNVNVTEEELAVSAIGNNTAHDLYNQDSTAKTYPTALNALYEVVDSMVASGGYVSSVTVTDPETNQDTTLAAYSSADWSTYWGWNYCVVRNGSIVEKGNLMSASIFELESNDSVYWAFGTSTQATAYFNTLVTAAQ